VAHRVASTAGGVADLVSAAANPSGTAPKVATAVRDGERSLAIRLITPTPSTTTTNSTVVMRNARDRRRHAQLPRGRPVASCRPIRLRLTADLDRAAPDDIEEHLAQLGRRIS
jgi:hypothetical protein